MMNRIFFLLVCGLVSFISIQNVYAVTVFPGTIIENPNTKYTADVHPNFNTSLIYTNTTNIFLDNTTYYDLFRTATVVNANITQFFPAENFTLKITSPVHDHVVMDVLGHLGTVKLGGFLYTEGTRWTYNGVFTSISVDSDTDVFGAFSGFSTLSSITSFANGTVGSNIANIQVAITYFGPPSHITAIQDQLYKDGHLVATSTFSQVINSTVTTLLPVMRTPVISSSTFYVVTIFTDGVHNYAVTSQNLILSGSDLPLTFWDLKYGASHSFDKKTNALTTMVRSTQTPFTYTVVVKNSTGAVSFNNSYTSYTPTDTRDYNISATAKVASLYIFAGGQQIYSANMGSSISLAAVSAFFHTNFSYQGFDLVSLIPIVFAGMFTRNTAGVGAVAVVLVIGVLNFLSVIALDDLYLVVMTTISCIGMVAYRVYYG